MGFEKCLTETDIVSRFALPIDWLRMLPPIEQAIQQRRCYIEGRLAVPSEWLKIFPPFENGSFEVQFEVTDGVGFYWHLCCSIGKKGYRKPVLQSEGWLKLSMPKASKLGTRLFSTRKADDFRGTKIRFRAQKELNRNGHWVDV
ncbi:hypothetical protein Pyn_11223 [Prunus yedoensis var. nudiflora]|uniref:B3 domain-containing protein n=1 Tax=Prunus yedoensis var. nudiflora TaxID=2094558 RepID=A0A314Z291_PRUYE|nr:hypothetical protein Pyn_11223 [Prunus yedoensis var. nudiflora]